MSSATSTDDTTTFRPWQFFLLAALAAATAGVFLSRSTTPAALITMSAAIGASGVAAFALLRMLWPLTGQHLGSLGDVRGRRSRAVLEREKMLVLRSIKELEFDRAMGKTSEADFQEMAARLRARALGLMRQLDEAGLGYRELIEREVQARLAVRRQGETVGRDTRPAVGPRPPAPSPPAAEPEEADDRPLGRLACAACGTQNDRDARFCKSCGTPVTCENGGAS